jgi:hypothetical protein
VINSYVACRKSSKYCAQKNFLLFPSRNLSRVALLVSMYQAERVEMKLYKDILSLKDESAAIMALPEHQMC